MNKDEQKKLLIELMQTDQELGLYDLSREDVDLIIKTCENSPEPNENLKQGIKNYEKQ